jgi:hypothetical protein
MNLTTFQRNFPPGVRMPDRLRDLLEFQNRSSDGYSGSFALSAWDFGYPAWFDGDRAAAEQFVVFGQNADGSLYTLWLYKGRIVADAPIVFLGSEGADCGLLADGLDEFLALLVVGADELGFAVSWGGEFASRRPAPRLKEFRSWLWESYGIAPSPDPMAVVAAARSRHPNFDAWLAEWVEARYGS